ncbi:unnamed protein product [Scytosiphon promiscuus]
MARTKQLLVTRDEDLEATCFPSCFQCLAPRRKQLSMGCVRWLGLRGEVDTWVETGTIVLSG